MVRTLMEMLSDRLLLLWLVYDAVKYKTFGETKIQKLCFLSEWKMLDAHEKGFNYDFIRLTHGPYSPDVEEDVEWLENNQLVEATPINEKVNLFRETRFGRKLLRDFDSVFMRNNVFTQKIAAINRKYAPMSLQDLLNEVYSMRHPYMKGEHRTIGELRPRTPLLYKMEAEKALVQFQITKEELATLDIYLDDESYRSVMQASEGAKRKSLLPFDEVF